MLDQLSNLKSNNNNSNSGNNNLNSNPTNTLNHLQNNNQFKNG